MNKTRSTVWKKEELFKPVRYCCGGGRHKIEGRAFVCELCGHDFCQLHIGKKALKSRPNALLCECHDSPPDSGSGKSTPCRRWAAKRAAQALYGSYPIHTPTDKMSDPEEAVPPSPDGEDSSPEEQCERDASMVCEMRDDDRGTVLANRATAGGRTRRRIRPVCCQVGCNS